jgi:hypothetical protein
MTKKEPTMKTPSLHIVKPTTVPQKVTRTTVDTILISPELLRGWELPPFQRPLRVNDKVLALAEVIKEDGGVIPGVMTIGVIGRQQYLLDGNHRREAFFISGCTEGYVDVRIHHFTDMATMGEEFVNLNSQLVKMRPDDILRGLEGMNSALSFIRSECPFVGYDMIRRSDRAPILSMSALLRCWYGGVNEVPKFSVGSATNIARQITLDEAKMLVSFVSLAIDAWGRDPEYYKLWGGLNLTIAAWLYRRLVIAPYSTKTIKLTKDQFKKCLMALSADSGYPDWLVGRNLCERDRSPCYSRMKSIFARRLEQETGKKHLLPSPAWSPTHGRGSGKK